MRVGLMFLVFTSELICLQQILNHMNESAVYNETDVAPFAKRLAELRQIVHQDGAESNKHSKAITRLLERQLNETGSFQ
jgi:hypothetical protein